MNVSGAIRALQKGAAYLPGKEASFRVYYWGGHQNHQDNPLHKHSFIEVCYVVDGVGLYLEDDRDYPLEKGVFFCSRPGKLHRIHQGDNLFLLWVAFEIDEDASSRKAIALFEQLAKTENFHLQHADQSPTALLWRTLLEHASYFYQDELLRSLGHCLLTSLQELFFQTGTATEKKQQASASEMIRQAQLFIRDNLAQPLSLHDVAQYLHLSPRHLSRLFSKNLNMSFTAFVRKERVRMAADMLRFTAVPIKTVAEATGFSSVHYFTYVFSEETSVTPGEYRKLYQV